MILISEAEALRKPDKALFQRAADKLGATPPTSFVRDNPVAHILRVADAGIKTTWFRSGQQWPSTGRPLPHVAIDTLIEVLRLVDE